MADGFVLAVCVSDKKGVPKKNVREGLLIANYGLEGDAHASSEWHRQVSLLAIESIEKMRQEGYEVAPGDFAENITCRGISLISLKVGTRLIIGDSVVLKVSQIGKECHTGCAIFQQVGKCIMPRDGIFAEVIKGGIVRVDDPIKIIDKIPDNS